MPKIVQISVSILKWWGCWHVYLSGTWCRFAYGPADATAMHYLLLQSIQIGFTRMVLPFWCRLTQVVVENHAKGFSCFKDIDTQT